MIGSNRFAHGTPYSDRPCLQARSGASSAVGGWALPPELAPADIETMAERLAAAIEDDADARSSRFVVVGGGVARRYRASSPRCNDASPTEW
ncbi:MAG: hypothetical protein R2705_19390 [Ilumatobacteraceae bacterium]